MKLLSAIQINFKKLKYRTGKALFLIVPISLLVFLAIILSSQISNIESALHNNVFSELGEESTLLSLEYQSDEFQFSGGGPGGGGFRNLASEQNGFTEADLQNILGIEHVTGASINYSLPNSRSITTDLFDGSTVNIGNLTALSSDLAGIYTSEDFRFDENTTEIPIIINSNAFIKTYEDWQGKDSISFDFEDIRKQLDEARENGEQITLQNGPVIASPMKSEAIEYNKEDLLGKTFTINFGGLEDIQDYEVSRDGTKTTFTKLTTEELKELSDTRKETVSKYWNYDKITKPITYTFKIVGVIEEEGNFASYIPEDFANELMSSLIKNQLDARTTTELSTSTLDSSFTGIYFDGSEITRSLNNFFRVDSSGGETAGPGPRMAVAFAGDEGQSGKYEIPGLVVKISSSDSSIEGLYTDTNVLEQSAKSGSIINIKVDDVTNRESVIKQINKLGYAYIDYSDLDVLANIESTLNQVSVGSSIAFIVLTAAIIVLTMSKFVSESVKEIGIFRAVGFTKKNILSLFTMQGLLYTGFAYILGVIIGVTGNLLVAPAVASWFEEFVNSTVAKTVNVVGTIDKSVFSNIDVNSLIILSITLLIITFVLSIIPAYRASNISPVEAIKAE